MIHPEYASALRAIIDDPKQPMICRTAALKEYRYLAENMPEGIEPRNYAACDAEYFADLFAEMAEQGYFNLPE